MSSFNFCLITEVDITYFFKGTFYQRAFGLGGRANLNLDHIRTVSTDFLQSAPKHPQIGLDQSLMYVHAQSLWVSQNN